MVAADEEASRHGPVRLAKFLAHAGVSSRRGAEAVIAAGRVTVAGLVVTDPALDVGESDAIAVDGRPLSGPEPRIVYALNKPLGVLSTARDTHGRRTVLELVPNRGLRLYPVGRLDADSTGLILLTNDGELANLLTHPRFEVPKTYLAEVGGAAVTDRTLRRLREGLELQDGPTAPARVRRLGPRKLELTIHEGRNRQVRRMCEAVGHPVLSLERTAFGPLALGGLDAGGWRLLDEAELERLRAAVL
jgi:23S rRNA pseudouridine2605 synthase